MIRISTSRSSRRSRQRRRNPLHGWRSEALAVSRSLGFSLVEVLITVTIIALLSAIAVPNYLNSLNKAKQTDAASQVSQTMSGIQAYFDEFQAPPGGWSDLGRVTTVMTPTGVAAGSSFTSINSQSGSYTITVTANSPSYTIAASSDKLGSAWGILACLNTSTGANQITRGNGSTGPTTPACS